MGKFLLRCSLFWCLLALGAASTNETQSDVCYTEGLKPELLYSIKAMFEAELLRLRQRGETRNNPAHSCQEILEQNPCHASGQYWIQGQSGPVRVHCDPSARCPGSVEGWVRVAHVNMQHSQSQCPGDLQNASSPRRHCRRTIDSGCSSAIFHTNGMNYSWVSGKVIGYQYGTTNAFGCGTEICSRVTIDGAYIDGVSITHGENPRKHIWSFAAAFDEVPDPEDTEWICPCTNGTVQFNGRIPSYVGEDYFCETGSHQKVSKQYYWTDPLWDRQGCGAASTCCGNSTAKPYFCKKLPLPTTDDIELRLCLDQDRDNEDILLEVIELYVQ